MSDGASGLGHMLSAMGGRRRMEFRGFVLVVVSLIFPIWEGRHGLAEETNTVYVTFIALSGCYGLVGAGFGDRGVVRGALWCCAAAYAAGLAAAFFPETAGDIFALRVPEMPPSMTEVGSVIAMTAWWGWTLALAGPILAATAPWSGKLLDRRSDNLPGRVGQEVA